MARQTPYLLAREYATLARMSKELRAYITQAGGLHTLAALAKRWGVSRQRAKELEQHPDFPTPVLVIGRSKLYAGHEADAWRAMERPPGRPRKD